MNEWIPACEAEKYSQYNLEWNADCTMFRASKDVSVHEAKKADKKVETLESENETLKARVAELEAIVTALESKESKESHAKKGHK